VKRLLLFSFLTFSLWISGYSQTISDVFFYLTKDQFIVVKYNISEAQSTQYFNVSLWVSRDGGTTFTGPLKHVTGDVGKRIRRGTGKEIQWDVNKEIPGFGGEIVFDVQADVIQKQKDTSQKEDSSTRKQTSVTRKQTEATPKHTNTTKKRANSTENLSAVKQSVKEHHFFMGYKGSYLAPFGVVLGVTGKPGFYLSARMNRHQNSDAEYTLDDPYINTKTTIPGVGYATGFIGEYSNITSVNAGLLYQIAKNISSYFGVGYKKTTDYGTVSLYNYQDVFLRRDVWAKTDYERLTGVELEIGFMFHLRHVFISTGLNTQFFKGHFTNTHFYFDGSLGVGVIF